MATSKPSLYSALATGSCQTAVSGDSEWQKRSWDQISKASSFNDTRGRDGLQAHSKMVIVFSERFWFPTTSTTTAAKASQRETGWRISSWDRRSDWTERRDQNIWCLCQRVDSLPTQMFDWQLSTPNVYTTKKSRVLTFLSAEVLSRVAPWLLIYSLIIRVCYCCDVIALHCLLLHIGTKKDFWWLTNHLKLHKDCRMNWQTVLQVTSQWVLIARLRQAITDIPLVLSFANIGARMFVITLGALLAGRVVPQNRKCTYFWCKENIGTER